MYASVSYLSSILALCPLILGKIWFLPQFHKQIFAISKKQFSKGHGLVHDTHYDIDLLSKGRRICSFLATYQDASKSL